MKTHVLLLAIICIGIVAGCKAEPKGIFQGKISIGPLCPIERNPPDPKCLPTAETYKAWPVGIYSSSNLVETISPDSTGNFRVELSTGTYQVKLERQQGIGGGNLPFVFTIKAGMNVTQDIEIDTGIR